MKSGVTMIEYVRDGSDTRRFLFRHPGAGRDPIFSE